MTARTGTGATPSHTYAAAGTYTVTLTVTDDDGRHRHRSAHDDHRRRPANQAPTAAFTSSSNVPDGQLRLGGFCRIPTARSPATPGTSVTAPPAPGRRRRTPTRAAGTYHGDVDGDRRRGRHRHHQPRHHGRGAAGAGSDTFGRTGRPAVGHGLRTVGPGGPNSTRLAVNGNVGTMSVTAGLGPGGVPQRRCRRVTSTPPSRSPSTSSAPAAASTARWSCAGSARPTTASRCG